jgi:hypothetical protein
VIRVEAPETRAAVVAEFLATLEPPEPAPVACLSIGGAADGYTIVGDGVPGMRGTICVALRRLRSRVTRHLIGARPDLLWLHAGAVSRDGRAVLIAGPGGSGKSTLATLLVDRGFRYLGDDVVALDPSTGEVHPFPASPLVRTDPGRPLSASEVLLLPRRRVAIDASRVDRAPTPVGLVVLPSYQPGELRIWRSSPAVAAIELVRHSMSFDTRPEDAIRTLSRWMCEWPAVGLAFDDPERAASLVAAQVAPAATSDVAATTLAR